MLRGGAIQDDAKRFSIVVSLVLGLIVFPTGAVEAAPTITNQPESTSTCSGTSVLFVVNGTASSTPTFQWQVQNVGSTAWNSTGTNSNTLSFTVGNVDNGKKYRVRISDNTGTSTSNVATLTVNPLPTQPSSVTNNTRCGTGTVNLSATPGSNGNTIRWYESQSGGNAIFTGTSFTTPSLSANRTYYVTTYNSTTLCESTSRREVTATIYPNNPAVYSTNNVYARGALSSGRVVATATDPDGAITSATIVSGGVLPTSLTLNSTGSITVNSTPTAGTYTRTIRLTDVNGCTSDVPVTIEITEDLYQASGNAFKTGTNCYQLTTATGNQQGQVWSVNTIDLNKSFEITFNAYFGTNDAGADGIAFGFQRVATNPVFASGTIGQGLGFQNITPSFGVEFDTYQNGSEPSVDHTNFFWNGSVTNSSAATITSTAPVQMHSTKTNVEDGINYPVKIIWNRETNTMSVYFDGVLRITRPGDDIVSRIFNGNGNVHFGYTASTGGSVNVHSVCEIKVNANPEITSNGGGSTATISVAENTSAVTTVTSTDLESNLRSYSIVGGADAEKFNINATTGALMFRTPPDFEAPGSAANTNAYYVTVRVTDNSSSTSFDEQDITVNVTNVNEAPTQPVDINAAANTVPENSPNGTLVGITARSTDPDAGATISYSLTNNAGGRFAINNSTGVVTVANGALLDFETATSHSITVQASDGSLSSSQSFTIAVTNVNEAPVITSNGGGATASINVPENTTAVTIVTATDVDANTTLTYSISGGADAAKFNINPTTRALTFITAPDFEAPGSAAGTNIYTVIVRAADNGSPALFSQQTITVNVTNVNEAPTVANVTNNTTLLNTASNVTLAPSLNATDDGVISNFQITTLPANGTLRVNGVVVNNTTQEFNWADKDKITYTHSNFVADASFSYRVKDAGGLYSNTATYTISINGVPIAKNITSQTILNTAGLTPINVTSGDYPTDDNDITNSSIIFTSVPNTTTQGTLRIGSNAVVANTPYPAISFAGGVSFTPVLSNLNDVVFNYKVRDSEGAESNSATITIPINGEPIANNVTSAAIPNKPVASPISPLSASDADGTIKNYKIVTLPESGKGVLYVNGVAATEGQVITPAQASQLSFRPSITYEENITFTFTAIDNEDAEDATPATYTIPVKLDVDIQLTNTILTAGPYYQGQNITIRVTATNIGTSPLYNGALVQDLLPTGLTYISNTSLNGQYNPSDDTWAPNNGVIAEGASYTFDITARLNAVGTITHTTNIISPNYTDFNLSNNATTYSLSVGANQAPVASNVITNPITNANVAQAIMPLDATDDGTIANYTIVTLPGNWLGVLYVNGAAVTEGQVITPAQAGQLSFRPSINYEASATFTFTATDNVGVSDATPATYTIPIRGFVDLELTHTVMTEGPYAKDQNVSIRFTITNRGSIGINGAIEVRDVLPAGLTFVSSSVGQSPSANYYNAAQDIWVASRDYMGVNGTSTFTIIATINSDAAFGHTTTVHAPNGIVDSNTANNNTTYAFSNGPIVEAVEIELDPDIPTAQDLTPLKAVITGGSVATYTILTLPDAASGTLYVRGIAATPGQFITPEEAGLLSFVLKSGFSRNLSTFSYTATDNFGKTATKSANYSLYFTPINPLPVELISFKATAQNNQVTLNWSTASETDNDRFEIERSQDGRKFTKIGTVKGKGTSSLTNHYTFKDSNPSSGTNYYRLRQVDFDGAFEYSKTVAANIKTISASVKTYPNPFHDYVRVELATEEIGQAQVMIMDVQGRVILERKIIIEGRFTELELPTQDLATGVYFLKIKGANMDTTTKLVKQR